MAGWWGGTMPILARVGRETGKVESGQSNNCSNIVVGLCVGANISTGQLSGLYALYAILSNDMIRT